MDNIGHVDGITCLDWKFGSGGREYYGAVPLLVNKEGNLLLDDICAQIPGSMRVAIDSAAKEGAAVRYEEIPAQ